MWWLFIAYIMCLGSADGARDERQAWRYAFIIVEHIIDDSQQTGRKNTHRYPYTEFSS